MPRILESSAKRYVYGLDMLPNALIIQNKELR